jgi:hypothetical protein
VTWLDLLIIYFSCGAPFAVYRITRSSVPLSVKTITISFVSLFGWPIIAVLLVFKSQTREEYASVRRVALDKIRALIEAELFIDNRSTSSIFTFREIYSRFTGLSEAAVLGSSMPAELLKVCDHPTTAVAGAILTRRNRERLQRHKTAARAEFLDEVFESKPTDALLGVIASLSALMEDPSLSNDCVARRIAQSRPRSGAATLVESR